MKQMTLWEVENDTKNEKHNQDPAQIGSAKLEKMTPCIICGVMPKVWKHTLPTHNIYTNAKCPVCGWHVSTPYDITEHWNKLNTESFRLK